MDKKIRVGIVGYGNLGKGVEKAIAQNPDMELAAVFTRRDPGSVKAGAPVFNIDEMEQYKDTIDVVLLCGGSATDLPEQTPMAAKLFNAVDSFDTHAKVPEHFEKVDAAAKAAGTVSIISAGWDPGLFSMARLLGNVVLPEGHDYTFWGEGVSQGHSDAIRRILGVAAGVQYTVPVKEAIAAVRSGSNPSLTTREKHKRVCYVVAKEGADRQAIEQAIVSMPNYFADYDTTVNFITMEELKANHSGMPHGGFAIRTGQTGEGTKQRIEFALELGSNPEFTASVLVACARAACRMAAQGMKGAFTLFDIPLAMLSPKSGAELRKELL